MLHAKTLGWCDTEGSMLGKADGVLEGLELIDGGADGALLFDGAVDGLIEG